MSPLLKRESDQGKAGEAGSNPRNDDVSSHIKAIQKKSREGGLEGQALPSVK